MTRAELIDRLAARHPQFSIRDVELAVTIIVDALGSSLAQDRRIEIRGFGSFTLHCRQPRQGRNPKTGKIVLVPAKRSPHFKAGKELRARVDARP